jgi:hypothetical protein
VTVTSRPEHRAKYQGKQLFALMLAICLPAALLYLRVVLGVTATGTRVTPAQAQALNRWSTVALGLFFAAQLVCARYIQRLFLPQRGGRVKNALQYAGVLVLCVLFSVTGAIMLEAFGWNVFLRVAR